MKWNLTSYFTIGEAAKAAHTTTETLRHYDHIGLVMSSKKDEWANYRYYKEQVIVRLNTVCVLQLMDLPLWEIKRLLEYDDLEKIVDFLAQVEKKADEKISALQYSKSKILLAKADYEKKLRARKSATDTIVKDIPECTILLSDTLERPTLDNLWNYLGHFYEKVTPVLKERFSFEDLTGIYTENGRSRLFAVCVGYAKISGLRRLPKGNYLCASCIEENRKGTLDAVINQGRTEYGVTLHFTMQLIVVSGILQ